MHRAIYNQIIAFGSRVCNTRSEHSNYIYLYLN